MTGPVGPDPAPVHPDRRPLLVLAVLAYLPMLWTAPGRVSADTKSYLTIDPGRLLARAWSMWDPSVGAGTVTHQNIGFLFPLGPLYRLADVAGVPDWLVQRLVWGTIAFAAAAGAYRLVRELGWAVAPAFVTAVAYGFGPYQLSYLARLSVILFPFAALPWLVIFASRAVRERGWRSPARFALVVGLVGSVNATSLVLVGLGPVVWVAVDWASGRLRSRNVLAATARTLACTLGVSLWWIVALRVQGAYGLPILRYTETYQAVAGASTAPELLRGLGYWFFYGGDRLGPWVGPSALYVHPVMIVVGAVLVGAALVGLTVAVPGRRRALALVVVGLTVAVGAAPLGSAPLFGRAFEWFATSTTAGFALRSTPRAAPVLALGLAIGLGACSLHLSRRLDAHRTATRRTRPDGSNGPSASTAGGAVRTFASRHLVHGVVLGLVIVQLSPWFLGRSTTPSILRDDALPPSRLLLAEHLDATGTARVWEVPGADFASHRWGGTVDPPLPGMIDRPYLARELVPQGSPGTADLLGAFERRLHEGWFEPGALVPVARRFGVGTVVLRNDLEHERYRLARPTALWPRLVDELGPPTHTGPVVSDDPVIPMLDELELADAAAVDRFPVLAAWDLEPDAVPWTVVTGSAMVVGGSGDGLVDLAAAGLLDHDRPVFYAGTLLGPATDGPSVDVPDHDLPSLLGDEPWLVVTDTNRRAGHRWSGLGAIRGALEAAGSEALVDDPGDNRLEVQPDRDDLRTVLTLHGDVRDVRATGYGNRIAYTAEDAPVFAVDGDPRTAWRTGVFDDIRGERLEITYRTEIAPDHVVLLQPVTRVTVRSLTRVRLHLDDHTTLDVDLDDRSRSEPGQRIDLPGVAFTTLTIELLADDRGPLANYAGQPGVGFAEVQVPGVRAEPVASVPTSWLDELAGVDPAVDRLDVVLTRERIDPATSNRGDPEPVLARSIRLPAMRTFRVEGTARLSAEADDHLLARVLDEPAIAIAERRLPGAPRARGASAVDGDRDTAWWTGFDEAVGARLHVDLGGPVEIGAITLDGPDDPRHVQPLEVAITLDHDPTTTVRVPVVRDRAHGGTATLPEVVTAAAVTIDVLAVEDLTTPEYFSGAPRVLPVAVAELSIVGPDGIERRPWAHRTGAPDRPLDDRCRDDLVTVDGRALPVRLLGTVAEALDRSPIRIEACETLTLGDRPHLIRSRPGHATGVEVDRVVLRSERTADPGTTGHSSTDSLTDPTGAIAVAGDRAGPTRIVLDLPPLTEESWLVFRESWNPGWTATRDGVDLGPPVLVDGFANAWPLTADASSSTIELVWAPQRAVNLALGASVAAAVLVLVLAWRPRRGDHELATLGTDATDGTHRTGRTSRPGIAARLARVHVVIVSLVFVVIGGPAASAGYLGAVALADRRLRVRVRTGAGIVGARAAVALVLVLWTLVTAVVVGLQLRYRFVADPDWPSRFELVSPVAWAAVAAAVGSATAPLGGTSGDAPPGAVPTPPRPSATRAHRTN